MCLPLAVSRVVQKRHRGKQKVIAGTRRIVGSLFMRRQNSRPSRPGSMRSRAAAAGSFVRDAASASSPEATATTV